MSEEPEKVEEELVEAPTPEQPTFEKATEFTPTIEDIWRKIQLYRDDVNVAIEAIRALGKDMLVQQENMQNLTMDLTYEMANLNKAFVKAIAEAPTVNSQVPQATATGQPAPVAPTQAYIEGIHWMEGKYGHFIFVHEKDSQELNKYAVELINYLNAVGGKANLYGKGYKINGNYLNQSDKPYKTV
jgi:hypothetical protein